MGRSQPSRRPSFLPFAWIPLALGSGAAAQNVRINGPLAQLGNGDVEHFTTSTDSTRAVFKADARTDELFELVSAPLAGGLNTYLSGGEAVHDVFRTTGGRVVYMTDAATDELFSVPVDGSAPATKLSGPLVAGGNVLGFELAGARVVFVADKVLDGQFELFSVHLDGSSAPLRLVPGTLVGGYRVGPGGESVAHTTPVVGNQDRLQVVPVDGGPALVLAHSGDGSAWSSDFHELRFAPDGVHVLYTTLRLYDAFFDFDLYAVRADGSQAPVPLNLGSYGEFNAPPVFALTPDGSRVVYREHDGRIYSVAPDGTQRVLLGNGLGFALAADGSRVVFHTASQLFSILADGSQAAVPLFGPGNTPRPYVISPDSATVVYAVAEMGTAFRGLWSVPIAGGAPILLNGPVLAGGLGATEFYPPSITPDSSRLVFVAEMTQADRRELYSAPLDGSQPHVRLSNPMVGNRDVLLVALAPDGQRALFTADQTHDETFELYSAPIDGSSLAVRCGEPFAGGPVLGDVQGFQVTADGQHLVYFADQDIDQVPDLYSAPTDGGVVPLRLTGALDSLGTLDPDFALGAQGAWIVFQLQLGSSSWRLYRVPLDGSAEPAEIEGNSLQFPSPYVLTPDESRVVYRMTVPGSGGAEALRSAALDGSGAPVALHPPMAAGRGVTGFQVAPGGQVVVYRADPDLDEVYELFRTPTDGGSGPVKLHPALNGARDVGAFAVDADGQHAVYLADQDVDGVTELYGAALAGGAPVKLSGALPAGGDVTTFVLTPDGEQVLYRADQVVDASFELFLVPIGGGPPLRLAPLAPTASVQPDFQVTADGLGVLFRADALVDNRNELFVVPIDASAAPQRISADMVPGGSVLTFAVSPDLARVLYRANQRVAGVIELFSAPLGGGPVAALDVLPAFGNVLSFQIAPDASAVFFRADGGTDQVFELYRAPLDGRFPAERVSRRLPTNGNVEPDYVALPGRRALYRADAEADSVLELFLSFVGTRHLPAATPTRTVIR